MSDEPEKKHRHRYSASRREEAAFILDVCASSRRDPEEWEKDSFLNGPDGMTVNVSYMPLLLDVHWRSVCLASSAFYATSMEPGTMTKANFYEICVEAAQRLREGWQLTGNRFCALWSYE